MNRYILEIKKNRASGPGFHTRDGSSVELWKILPHAGEADIVTSCMPPPATLLELGCGTGRITRELVDRGYTVTAVDFSSEMLEHIPYTKIVCADIASLRLNQRFDTVLLGSYLLNAPDHEQRGALLRTCAMHCSSTGHILIERHPENAANRVRPGLIANEPDGMTVSWLGDARADGRLISGTLEWRHPSGVWTQTFSAYILSDTALEEELKHEGLRIVRYVDASHRWVMVRPV